MHYFKPSKNDFEKSINLLVKSYIGVQLIEPLLVIDRDSLVATVINKNDLWEFNYCGSEEPRYRSEVYGSCDLWAFGNFLESYTANKIDINKIDDSVMKNLTDRYFKDLSGCFYNNDF